jgi:site-specific recombinase XerD
MNTSINSAHSFEEYLQSRNFAYKTIIRHQREVKKYKNRLKLIYNQTPENTTKKQLLEYLQYVKESRKLSNDSQNNILKILKNYYKYLSAIYDTQNITAFIKIRGLVRKKLQSLFMPDELVLLCDAYYYFVKEYQPTTRQLRFYPDYTDILQGRYIALTLFVYQGLRVQEVQKITKENFDLHKAVINIPSSKSATARKLPLDASQIGVLMQYYAYEDKLIIHNSSQLDGLSKTLKELTRKPTAAITAFKDFKQLRASKITHWIKLYGLRKAQYMAGHRNIYTTEQYIANNIEVLQNDFDNFHPLN